MTQRKEDARALGRLAVAVTRGVGSVRFNRCVTKYLRSIDLNRIGGGDEHRRLERRDPTEKSSIGYYKKTRVCYENIVDAGGTFRVYCWGNMLTCGESSCRDMISVGK